MGKFCNDFVEFFELMNRISMDSVPKKADAGILFGELVENEEPMLIALAALANSGRVEKIAVTGFGGSSRPPLIQSSSEEFKRKLIARSVKPESLVTYGLAAELPPCTDAEAIGFVRKANKEEWRSADVVVPPLHAVRAFLSTVSATAKAMKQGGVSLRIYNYPADALCWTEEVRHSQSAPKGRRADLLSSELQKIERYCEKGDLLTAREVLDYLDWRDAR